MTYRAAAALQAAIYAKLVALPELAGLSVIDAMPAGGVGGTFVLIGPEEVRDASDASGAGAEHRPVISVISDATGFLAAKAAAVAITDALEDLVLDPAVGRLVSMQFLRAVARRLEDGGVRRIDLTFRARIEF